MRNRYAIKKDLINMERFVKGDMIMKKVLAVLLFLSFIGCASVTSPSYIQDKNPYKKVFYTQFDKTREAIKKTFKESGWTIEKEAKPAVFERERDSESGNNQILILTEVRQISFFIGSRYARINVYLHEIADNETEVEIRYLTVTSVMFKSFYGYKHDQAVERIFTTIEENLSF